jgi:hypothetical protein
VKGSELFTDEQQSGSAGRINGEAQRGSHGTLVRRLDQAGESYWHRDFVTYYKIEDGAAWLIESVIEASLQCVPSRHERNGLLKRFPSEVSFKLGINRSNAQAVESS